jgi:hypothetical protein
VLTGVPRPAGRVRRLPAKVLHVVVRARCAKDDSSPRDARSQRPGDNSTRIARTAAKWHSKPAWKSHSSSPDASSWLLSPRDDAGQHELRGVSEAESTRTYVRRSEESFACIWSAATSPTLSGHSLVLVTERGISAVCPRWPPKAQTTPKLRGSSIFILSNDPCNRLQKTPSKTPQKRLLTTFQTQPRAVSRRTAKPSYAVEQRDQAKHPRTAKPGYTPSNNEKTWPPPPREARVSCPTSTWAQPSSCSSS